MYNINGNNSDNGQPTPFNGLQAPSASTAPMAALPGFTIPQQYPMQQYPMQQYPGVGFPSGYPSSSLPGNAANVNGGAQSPQALLQDLVTLTSLQQNPLMNQSAIPSDLMNNEQQLGSALGGQNDLSPEQQMLNAIQNGAATPQTPEQQFGNLASLAFGSTTPQLSQPMQNASTPGFAGAGLNTMDSDQNVGNAAITTNGDPHIASNIDGQQSWSDNQGSQSDFLDANTSFAGGYQESTQVGNADSKGNAYNQQISFQVGGAQVTATGSKGDVSVSVNSGNGSTQTLSKGQSVTTADGATITLDQNGKLEVTDNNQTGGTLTTTVSTNGHGLDATSSGSGVNLGGFAVGQNEQGIQTGTGKGKGDIGS